ncbi:MAG: beta-lactamase family protein [Acidobacteriota bacterium]|nr:MAG: beta-lactamase family protein [Acidobacteriota bacterium]
MRNRVLSLFFSAMFSTGPIFCTETTSEEGSPDLRLAEPVDAVVADLDSYISQFMDQEAIPGVAIALLRDSRIVWSAGYGVTNTLTREPVISETLFEVASNSKVMTAYIALRLVDAGELSLDTPLNHYLKDPWLPPSLYRDVITLRQVLSHSSGLGHNSLSRENLFAPGRGYSYSGMGYLYLQHVIEAITGRDLEEVAQEHLFVPLGMHSSSYVNEDSELTSRTAGGHLTAVVPSLFFVVLYLAALLVVALVGFPVLRIWTGRWTPTRPIMLGAAITALVVSMTPPFVGLRWLGLSEFAWAIALSGLALFASLGLLLIVGRSAANWLLPARKRTRVAVQIAWGLLAVIGLSFLVIKTRNLPMPRWTPVPSGAASSVRATVGDMATFLVEISNPRFLNEETGRQLRTSQVQLSEDLSWGLGPGIQHSRQGDALWQWGQHLDFQSVMIIYPDSGLGVVVLTNSDLFNPDVAIRIAHRAIGGPIEPILRASHTEFDYRE